MSYKIAFFDIDGTLVNEDKQIPQDALEAIFELKEKGVEPVIATGRAPYFFHHLAEQLHINSYVSLNGGFVVYQGEVIYKRPIERSDVECFVKRAAEHAHSLVFEGHHTFSTNNDQDPFMIDAVSSLKVELPLLHEAFWQEEDIYQIFLHCKEEDEPLYEGHVPGLRMIRWHHTALDVLPKGSSKAEGIHAMLDILKLTPEEAIAFGDGLNDMEMLNAVGLGIAMGNSHEDLKPYADYITTHVNEGGIANGLRYAGLIE
ncbi:Cof-type HAD-IIB family hydrolase [Paenibacillus aquistagni]|uniref:Cof-type HAD-IIB family hydrolase n=1 Tax=Paenibacillus aquistagni TaxID=1852522 RepID=UPI000B504E66|nr:Cof-type HAD-IIB family hydrolase [Paenibacillus aquistagni]